jgi:hypothetical protein
LARPENDTCSAGGARERAAVGPSVSWQSHLLGVRATDTNPTRLEDNEVARESLTALLDQLEDGSWKICASPRGEPKQKNAIRRFVGMHQLTEVFVLSQQDPAFADRELQHNVVRGPCRDLCDCDHIVTGNAEGADDGEVTALIRQKPHRSTSCALAAAPPGGLEDHRLLVRHRVRRVADGRLDVLA